MKKIFAVPAALALIGCAGTDARLSPPIAATEEAAPAETPPEQAGLLAITQLGDTVFLSGMPCIVTIAVRNVGQTGVELPLWHVRDSDNLIFRYIECDESGNLPEDTKISDWTVQKPVIEKPAFYPLALMPGNTVLLRGELSFVEKLPETHPPASYLVVVELNQSKFRLATEPFVIKVIP